MMPLVDVLKQTRYDSVRLYVISRRHSHSHMQRQRQRQMHNLLIDTIRAAVFMIEAASSRERHGSNK